MCKTVKIWLITAAVLLLAGCIIFGGAMAMAGWDITKLSTDKYETNRHAITEEFRSISVDTSTADVIFVPSENDEFAVECYESKKRKHSVCVKDGALTIECTDTRKWYEHIGISFTTPKITVYIPQGEYGALSVKIKTGNVEIPKDFAFSSIDVTGSTGSINNYASASGAINLKTITGNIDMENASAGAIDLAVSTGKITVSDVTCAGDLAVGVTTGKSYFTNVSCKKFVSNGSTGDIFLQNVTASDTFSVKRSTGDVTLDGADAAELFVKTDTGDVTGRLLTDKIFIAKSDTGDIDVPNSVTGGRCEITTDTGDIRITVD